MSQLTLNSRSWVNAPAHVMIAALSRRRKSRVIWVYGSQLKDCKQHTTMVM
jgi:hypothetical protein